MSEWVVVVVVVGGRGRAPQRSSDRSRGFTHVVLQVDNGARPWRCDPEPLVRNLCNFGWVATRVIGTLNCARQTQGHAAGRGGGGTQSNQHDQHNSNLHPTALYCALSPLARLPEGTEMRKDSNVLYINVFHCVIDRH